MRDTLTAIATLVVLALIAAMVGPYFVDWAGRRDQVAGEISSRIGIETRIGGRLSLTILPTPSLDVEAIEFGPKDAPFARAERLTLTLSPMALLSGRVQVSAARADRPKLARAALARFLAVQQMLERPDQVGIEQLDLTGLSIVETMAGEAAAFYDAVLSAPSLAGPFRLDVTEAGGGRELRAQIGRLEGGSARMKATIEDKLLGARIVLDGTLALPGQPGRPVFDGSAIASGNPVIGGAEGIQLPFQSAARVTAHEDRVIADPMNITLGSGEGALQLEGLLAAEIAGGGPAFDARFNAKRLDATALVSKDKQGRWSIDPRVLRALSASRRPLPAGVNGRVELNAGAVQLPGFQMQNAATNLAFSDGYAALAALDLAMPGNTRAQYRRNGGAGKAETPWLDGRIELEAGDLPSLAAAFGGPESAVGVPPRLKLGTRVTARADGYALEGFRLESTAGTLSGDLAIATPEPGRRPLPRLAVNLAAERFDARTLGLFDPLRAAPGYDLQAELDIRRLALDGNDLGGLRLALERDGDRANLRHLRLTGLKGEEISASGTIGADNLQLTGKLDAERLGDIARLAATLLPGPLTGAIAARADALEPAIGVASLRMSMKDANAVWDVQAEGKLGGTNITGRSVSTQQAGELALKLEADLANPDGARLLQQITGLALPQSGAGRLKLRGEGTPARGVLGTVEARLGATEIGFEGDFGLFRQQGFGGKLRIAAPQLGGFERLFGTAEGMAVPYSVNARLSLDQSKLVLGDLSVTSGATAATGEVAFDLSRGGQVAGRIRTGTINLPAFLAPAIGEFWPSVPQGWAKTGFAPARGMPVAGDLWIEAKTARLGEGITLGDPQFVWRWAQGSAGIEGFEASLGDARFSGQITLLRRAERLDLAGRISLARLPLGRIPGRFSGEMPVSGGGANPTEFIASLSGAGRVSLDGLVIAAADSGALSRITAMPLEALEPIEENNVGARIDRELQKGELRLPAMTLPASLSSGQLRFGGTPVAGQSGESGGPGVTPGFIVDLLRREAEVRLQIGQSQLPPRWRGAQPEITLSLSARADTPGLRRNLQVSSLVNGLLAMAIQRDLERAEAFDADIREREAQLRRQRGDAFMLRREREIIEFEAIVRREAEALARRAEEEKRKAEQPAATGAPVNLSPPGGTVLPRPAPQSPPPG